MKQGKIIISSSSVKLELAPNGSVWMNTNEIADLFHIKRGVVESNLKEILKANSIWVNTLTKEVIKPTNGKQCRIELFNLEIIIALSFRIDGYTCSIFRQWCVRQIIANQTKKTELFIQLGASTILN